MSDRKLYQKPGDLQEKIHSWEEPTISSLGKGILEERYLVRDADGKVIETPKEMLYRVSHVIADVDSQYGDFNPKQTGREFYDLMAQGKFLPNSPTLRGAGFDINLSACYVVPINDSREGIFKEALYNAVEIQAHGGGTGFNFSRLRARGSLIKSTRGKASGPISFMEIFDHTIGKTIAQGGTRQGANMGILDYNHPDIEKFITCKSEDGAIRNFNISVGVTEEFMRMAEEGKEYALVDHNGKEVRKVNAKEIFDKIVKNAWKGGDPGIIFLDRIERDNPTPHLGKITGTNPCGEQPLLDLEACNLGSINVRAFVKNGTIDWNGLEKTVLGAVHFLDNVIDANRYPVEKTEREKAQLRQVLEQYVSNTEEIDLIIKEFAKSPVEEMVKKNRKIGLGIMGFSDMLVAMGVEYGSEESLRLAGELMGFISQKADEASVKLAEKRGVFSGWEGSVYDSKSKYFKGKEMKLRNATRTTIAPTGTLSTLLGINGGIEPMFGVAYSRKAVYDENEVPKLEEIVVDSEFKQFLERENLYTPEFLKEILNNHGSLEGVRKPITLDRKKWQEAKRIFTTAHDLSYIEHIGMQAAFQQHVDNAISKTINLQKGATEEDVRNAYVEAYKTGIKGITIYRDGSRKGQVLSTIQEMKDGTDRPKVRGTTLKYPTPLGKAFITVNVLDRDHSVPYESFVGIGKGGKDINSIGEGFGRLISLLFKNGVPIGDVIEQLKGISSETQSGFGENKLFSLADAIGKGLEEAYLQLNRDSKRTNTNGFSGNFCPECGSRMMMMEGCQKCTNIKCGFSKC